MTARDSQGRFTADGTDVLEYQQPRKYPLNLGNCPVFDSDRADELAAAAALAEQELAGTMAARDAEIDAAYPALVLIPSADPADPGIGELDEDQQARFDRVFGEEMLP